MKSKKSKNPNKYLIGSIFSPPFPITFAKMLKFDRSLPWINSLHSVQFFPSIWTAFGKSRSRNIKNYNRLPLSSTLSFLLSTFSPPLQRPSRNLDRKNGKITIIIEHRPSIIPFFVQFFSFFFLFTVSSPPPHLPPQSSSYRFLLFPLLILGPFPLLPPLSLPRRVFTSPSLVLELVHLRVYSR